ncbi:tetratricopeptide repeat protein [Winogradskyella bathintestinalis]|uniref:Tetratricopeptide repeat protein n=1 Tax=Winogradskyella bathintestinalis TaxID=3035208 RepID=A0ABT7ZQT7_9FLAO|nr:tetratricopeptide repeat protein [Winogradskyella bathintestinalis]MDN3491380.1 tetratricopeptide repeat protein [Winogradskyella bathintestinalis]
MKFYLVFIGLLMGCFGFSQNLDKAQIEAEKNATGLVYKANELVGEDNYIEAEMAYRKAISEAPTKAVGAYNLAHSYYEKGNFDEALFRTQEAAKNAVSKEEKHKAFHNLGNVLMENKACKEAVEAFKNALRNNPNDEETRYNFVIAKECAEQQKQDGGGEDDKKDENKDDQQDKEDEQKKEDENKDNKDKKDEGDQDKKDGDKDKDEDGKPKDDKKDDKKDDGKGDKDKEDPNQKPKPQPGQMSPQQIKNILEAMQNQEQKVQEKMNAEKQKGSKVKTEKDW